MDVTVVCIDQTRNQYKSSRVVSARHTRSAVDLSGQRDWTCLLGAITEDGDRFFSRFTEYVTGEHSKHFILALCEEFDDDLIVVLDGAPYFQASVVTDLVARDDFAFVWLPSIFTGIEPGRGVLAAADRCSQQPVVDSLEQLNTAIDTVLDEILAPDLSDLLAELRR